MDIINRIMKLLKSRGEEQKDLTNYLGLNAVAFTDWKSGKSKSYRKYLIEIAEYFGVSIDYLVYGSEKLSDLGAQEKELADIFQRADESGRAEIIKYARYIASDK